MTADWIPFHRRLAKGPKKSIPRAIRFVLLELSLEARAARGVIDLPVDWDTLDALHDLLGGDRREIRKALQIFSIPDASGAPALKIVRDQLQHRLVLTKWEEWAGPKSSTERVRDHRENKRIAAHVTFHSETHVTPTVQDSTEQERRGSDARARGEPSEEPGVSERRLKSVRPPPPDPEPSEAAVPAFGPPPTDRRGRDSEDAAPGNLGGAGAVASGGSESGYDLARRLWSEAWHGKYRRPYDFSPRMGPGSEDYVLQRVGESASIRVGPGAAEAYLRHKFAAYLRDHGTRGYLDEECHPLRCLERDWAKYGEPKEPKRMVPRREEPVELVSVEEMAARAAAAMTMPVAAEKKASGER